MTPKTRSAEEFHRFNDAAEWREWLAAHHSASAGAWLLIAKKGVKGPGLSISDALDEALCQGWIDSQRKGYDDSHYLQRYSLRRNKSPWSKLNVQRAEALTKQGRMQEAGFKEIDLAKADGRWAVAYESQREFELPEDVAVALAMHPGARKAFEAMSKSARYALLLPLLKVTKREVRSRRLQRMISGLDG